MDIKKSCDRKAFHTNVSVSVFAIRGDPANVQHCSEVEEARHRSQTPRSSVRAYHCQKFVQAKDGLSVTCKIASNTTNTVSLNLETLSSTNFKVVEHRLYMYSAPPPIL